MSINNSYFNRNNTIVFNSFANTGRNPVTELFFGSENNLISNPGYSRFIFNIDLSLLFEKVSTGVISLNCNSGMTHHLKMTNTSSFDEELLNTTNSSGRRRATSFDLILFRIPESVCSPTTTTTTLPVTTTTTLPTPTATSTPVTTTTTFNPCNPPEPTPTPTEVVNTFIEPYGPNMSPIVTITTTCNPLPQYWDEGVGYDYLPTKMTSNTSSGSQSTFEPNTDKTYSDRPSNWFQTTTLDFWTEPGIYNNLNLGNFNFNDLYIVNTQHFEFGDEDINFNMTDEINGIINGTITGVTGYGIAYMPDLENITGLTENYSVGFFTRHTQTFYEPYLQTTYNDLIEDDRNLFTEYKENRLYLYTYLYGEDIVLDENPIVDILNHNGDPISSLTGLSTCLRTKGVYEVVIPPMSGYNTPCQFTDVWRNIKYNGVLMPNIENEFILSPYKKSFQIGSQSKDPEIFGFDYYGILQDEKILNTDIRKVGVVIKKAYTAAVVLVPVEASYRVYVKEGQTEVQVQDWTPINRTPNEYYFIFDTRDKIPNEYFIDIKVVSSGQVNTYKKQIKFQIVNKK